MTQGQFAMVSDCDYERVNQHKWYAYKHRGQYYAQRNVPDGKKQRTEQMHRFILDLPPKNPMVDHRDGVGLNNQRENIRECNNGQNMANRKPNKNGSSKYKGVSKRPDNPKFIALIRVDKKRVSLGSYETEEDAARAYNIAAIKYKGEFARLNIIE